MKIDQEFRMLREREVAKLLDISIYTIQRMRCSGNGPKFCRIGSSVRYLFKDIQDYIENNTLKSTSDQTDGKE